MNKISSEEYSTNSSSRKYGKQFYTRGVWSRSWKYLLPPWYWCNMNFAALHCEQCEHKRYFTSCLENLVTSTNVSGDITFTIVFQQPSMHIQHRAKYPSTHVSKGETGTNLPFFVELYVRTFSKHEAVYNFNSILTYILNSRCIVLWPHGSECTSLPLYLKQIIM